MDQDSDDKTSAPERDRVTVVLPTRNSEALIERCLSSVRSQTYSRIDVIVVDNYSSDRTVELARDLGANVCVGGPAPPSNNFFTAPITRRLGGSMAKGGYLYFVDSDMVLQPDVVEECVRLCDEGAAAVVVPEIPTGEGFWARCKVEERLSYLGNAFMEAPRFLRADAYGKIGGWPDASGGFDDWAVRAALERLHLPIARSQASVYHDEGHLTLRKAWNKKRFMGRSASVGKHLDALGGKPGAVSAQLSPARVVILVNGLARNSVGVRDAVGVLILKTVETAGFISGRLAGTEHPVT